MKCDYCCMFQIVPEYLGTSSAAPRIGRLSSRPLSNDWLFSNPPGGLDPRWKPFWSDISHSCRKACSRVCKRRWCGWTGTSLPRLFIIYKDKWKYLPRIMHVILWNNSTETLNTKQLELTLFMTKCVTVYLQNLPALTTAPLRYQPSNIPWVFLLTVALCCFMTASGGLSASKRPFLMRPTWREDERGIFSK